jgi:virginiamycin B lyase
VTINEFPIPINGGNPSDIVTGPDRALWFTENGDDKIGRIDPATGAIAEFVLPTPQAEPFGLVAGPDGGLWFTEFQADKIGRIDPTTRAISEFPVPTASAEPVAIAAGADGALWFSEQLANRIARIDPATHAIAEFPIPTRDSNPTGIAPGPDGALWFAENTGNKIGRIDPTTRAISEFPVPTSGCLPEGITVGPDGALWFTEENGNKIGRIDPTTHVITEFPIPTALSLPLRITTGPDGNLWFTEHGDGKIGQINPTTHAIAEFPLPTSHTFPLGITTGPDGNLWFTDEAGAIDQAVIVAPSTAPHLTLSDDAPASVTLGNDLAYTLTVANDGDAGATGVTLTDTLPAGVNFVSATGGVAPVGGVLTFHIGDLAAGASVLFTIAVVATGAGVLHNHASASDDEAGSTPADDRVTQVTAITPITPANGADGPIVTSVGRYGSRRQPSELVLTFNEPLDAARAQDLTNYLLFALGGHRRQTTRSRHPFTIRSATYVARGPSVALSFSRFRLNRHRIYELVVKGTAPGGLTGLDGRYLDGRDDGQSGTDYVTILDGDALVLSGAGPNHRGPSSPGAPYVPPGGRWRDSRPETRLSGMIPAR